MKLYSSPLLPNWFARAGIQRETDGLSGSLLGMESEVGKCVISLHPRKTNMETENTPLEKEKHLQTTSFAYSMLHEFLGKHSRLEYLHHVGVCIIFPPVKLWTSSQLCSWQLQGIRGKERQNRDINSNQQTQVLWDERFPDTLSKFHNSPLKRMIGRLLSFWEGNYFQGLC